MQDKLKTLRYVIVKSDEPNAVYPYHVVDTDDFSDFNPNTGEDTEYYKTEDNDLYCVCHILISWYDGGVYEDQSWKVGKIVAELKDLSGLSEFLTLNTQDIKQVE